MDPTTPLPSPPFHPIPNIQNLRDPALYPLTTPHGPLRPGILFRSADVSALTRSGWSALSALGVRHIFDLRSEQEIERSNRAQEQEDLDKKDGEEPKWIQSMHASNISRTWTPIFKAQDYAPEKLAGRYIKYMSSDVQGFVSAYEDILREGGAAYGVILRHIAALPAPSNTNDGENESRGVLIHCTAGKDRTGIFYALLFTFLGVERECIAAEYQLTEQGLAGIRESVVQRLMGSVAFRQYMASKKMGGVVGGEEDLGKLMEGGEGDVQVELSGEELEEGRKAALRMVGARKESMLASLDMLERVFGGAERYMREYCELGDGELEALRRNLVGGR